MRVRINKPRKWYAPNGYLYEPGEYNFKSAWKDLLPSNAEILSDDSTELPDEPELELKQKEEPEKAPTKTQKLDLGAKK